MKAIQFVVGSFLFLALFASASMAQVQRTFVSGLGSDSNPCSRTAPCRTFTQAIQQTNPGGELIVLDSAGYSAVTITKSISLIAPPGVYAGISVFSGDGIEINAGGSDTVILRGLTVNNQGSPGNGVVFNTGLKLHVENCVINGFSSNQGLSLLAGGSLVEVKDSIMRGNAFGIFVLPSSGTARVTIEHVRLEGGNFGLIARETSVVTVRNSVASGNGSSGFLASSSAAGSARLSLEGCVASNNFDGIDAENTSTGPAEVNVESCVASGNTNNGILAQSLSTGVVTVRLSGSTVTDNSVGIQNFDSSALVLSRGNNTVEGNSTNTSGLIGSYTAK